MRWTLAIWLALLVLGLAVPTAQAQADTSITIEAHDDDAECPGERTYCYKVTEGSLDDLAPGTSVEITFVNAGQLEHEIVMAPLSAADPANEDTSEDQAIDEIEEVGPGEEKTMTFEIPSDIDGIYLWCDIAGHENLGMWSEQSFEAGGTNGSPGPMAGVLAALAVAALVGRVTGR